MRLNISAGSTCVGGVEIHETFRVVELDAGPSRKYEGSALPAEFTVGSRSVPFSHEALHEIETQLAIVIPCMNEDLDILDGVLHGIPHSCLIIVVSNSTISTYEAECSLLTDFCRTTERDGIAVHQKDEGVAKAFHAAGMPEIVVETSRSQAQKTALHIRNGKGEAMLMGVAIAKLAGKEFVGFIDADNFVAGSALEYSKAFAAGLRYAQNRTDRSAYTMVRIKWNSKPKVKDGKLVFETSGRCSRVVNGWMNGLQEALVGNESQNASIQTANAGEHAMSMNLAMKLRFATGYAVEPHQLINAWELFGTPSPDAANTSSSTKVRVLQIETRSPHFHDSSKGNDHIQRMQFQGLSTLYHSEIAPQKLKDDLGMFMKHDFPTLVDAKGQPERLRTYPPLETMDFEEFGSMLNTHAHILWVTQTSTFRSNGA
jgi:mannosyl-3-phosphoglycerate synthase